MALSSKFMKDVQWFATYLPITNGVYIMHDDNRVPLQVYVDACSTGGWNCLWH